MAGDLTVLSHRRAPGWLRGHVLAPGALEAACGLVANATQAIRNTAIWGEAGTAQEVRRLGRQPDDGMACPLWRSRVMIYWHVEKGSTCIFSQLKRCSSSEVAAMTKVLLRHYTNVEIQRQYVDSHGQSALGVPFAACSGSTCRHA
ncbi:Tn3 family transposase [Mesorhizobium sp. L-8-10]|uniref:Tn3 family transposase n=1 Tax=Mesorhizobium sp. L-8-10 TaxID=2744523 RepID=UPI0019281130|nr:Tn3 family transposase [Mesorhizobium sp. L-8-10]